MLTKKENFNNEWCWREQTTGIPKKIPVEEKNNDSILECENIINNMKNRPLLKNGSDAAYSCLIRTLNPETSGQIFC